MTSESSAAEAALAQLDPNRDVFEQGLDYSGVLRLLQALARSGVDVELESFLCEPTPQNLRRLIDESAGSKPGPREALEPAAARGATRNTTETPAPDGGELIKLLQEAELDPELDADADLFEQGLTSLMLLRLLSKARQRWHVDIALDDVLRRPTLRHLLELSGRGQGAAAKAEPTGTEPRRPLPPGVGWSEQEKASFLARGHNLRAAELSAEPPVTLDVDTTAFALEYERRQSARGFAGPLSRAQLASWLAALAGVEVDGKRRYLYPSAGSTYAVQVYVEVRPQRVESLEAGIYYYHPSRHELHRLSAGAISTREHFFYNRELSEAAACAVYLVGELAGIAPLYGELAEPFLHVEAGAMLQLLRERQCKLGIGCRILAGLDPQTLLQRIGARPSQRLLLTLVAGAPEAARSAVHTARHPAQRVDPAVIVGVQVRLPGASGLGRYWQNLAAGRVAVDLPGTLRRRAGDVDESLAGWLDCIDEFPLEALGLSLDEARAMDPQERLVLESVYLLLEESGHGGRNRQRLGPDVGVFVGAMWDDSQARVHRLEPHAPLSSIANRISHHFDWAGPSLVVDTSCSSALSAFAVACDALEQGRCSTAVVVGVNVLGHREHLANLRRLGLLGEGPDSQVFGSRASGWLAGEGVGSLLLRPRSIAQSEGDHIWALVRAATLMSAGRSGRYGAPRSDRQGQLLSRALRRAQLAADDIDYVEAAAAGSAIGDACEARAIRDALGKRSRPLLVGSMKPNVGHLESASGMAQIAKVLLQFQKRRILGTLLPDELNPLIEAEACAFEIARTPREWQADAGRPRRALINGFGGTGSYATLILEESGANAGPDVNAESAPECAFLLSASSTDELREYAQSLIAWLREVAAHPPAPLDVAASLYWGRDLRRERLAIVARSLRELESALASFTLGEPLPQHQLGSITPPAAADMAAPAQLGSARDAARAWVNETQPSIAPAGVSGGARKVPLPPRPSRRVPLGATGGVENVPRSPALPEPTQRAAHVERLVTTCLRRELSAELPLLTRETRWSTLGLSSLGVVRVVAELQRALQVSLPPDLLLTLPAWGELVDHLAGLEAGAPPVRSDASPAVDAAPTNVFSGCHSSAPQLPLSEGQKGLWALHTLQRTSSAYNCPLSYRVRGGLSIATVEAACERLLHDFPLLSMTFRERGGQPLHEVARHRQISVEELPQVSSEADAIDTLRACARQPFDLERELPLRIHFLPRTDDVLLLFTLHHIVFDGGSFSALTKRFFDLCAYFATGEPALPEAPRASFFDFVREEAALLAGDAGAARLAHWREALAELPPPLQLPEASSPGAAGRQFSELLLSPEQTRRLAAFVDQFECFPSTLLLALFGALLCRYSGQDRALVGMPVDQRTRAEQREAIGFFVNMLPAIVHAPGNLSLLEVVQELQRGLLRAFANSYPWPRLVRELGLGAPGQGSLLQLGFTYQGSTGRDALQTQAGPFQIDTLEAIVQDGEFDLSLEVYERSQGALLRLHYASGRIDPLVTQHLLRHLAQLLDESLSAPRAPLATHPALTADERSSFAAWNATAHPHDLETRLDRLITRQCERSGDARCISFEGNSLSYAELDRRSNQLARLLRRHQVGPDVLVGVCMDRSLELPVVLTAILKAGGAYVPIDPETPKKRIEFILGEIQSPVLISQARFAATLADVGSRLILVDASDELSGEPDSALDPIGCARDLAYVIYTSGSTGQPKGCMISHGAIVNRLAWMQRRYRLDASDRVLQKTPFSFDVSVWEFFWPLLCGATLVLAAPKRHGDPRYLMDLVERERISVCHFVPSMLRAFVAELARPRCTSLRTVFASGEALPYELVEMWHERSSCELHNLYGPTEAAVDVTHYRTRARPDRRVPIGRPIDNCQIHILGKRGEPLPLGVPGELYIGGVGLARGYWKRPELTGDKFVTHPTVNGARLYRTGDLARWLPEGNVEYLGRLDQQVKIRGFRIELGEIEACINQIADIRQCAVAAEKDATGDVGLTAYVVSADNARIEASRLRSQLRAELPEHMLPTRVVTLGALPLTPSGKLDRKALRAPSQPSLSSNPALASAPLVTPDLPMPPLAAASNDDLERRLQAIWCELLDMRHVSLDADFFELGGHSLKLATLVTRVEQSFSRSFDPVRFSQRPTIAGLCALLGQREPERPEPLPALWLPSEPAELSLLCCPYAGAQATVFRPLARAIERSSARVAVYAVNAEAITDHAGMSLEELAEACAERAASMLTTPIAVYGHCIGSFLALEIVRRLERMGRPVRVLIAAASFPFHRLVRIVPFDDVWRAVSDQRIHALMQHWGARADAMDDATRRTMVSRFRADAKRAFAYQKRGPTFRIAAPIVNVVSANDRLTTGYEKRHLRWLAFSDDVHLKVLDGGEHYFVGSRAEELGALIGDVQQSPARYATRTPRPSLEVPPLAAGHAVSAE